MNKEINQDIGGIKDDFYKGLSLREVVYGVAAFLAGAGGVAAMVFVYHVNVNIAITVCIPVLAVIGLCGFYSRNGMTLPAIIKKAFRLKRQKPLTWCSRQGEKESSIKPEPEAKGIEGILIRIEERRQKG